MDKKIIIIGAGPCGLGAAWRLQELGYDNWQIFEKNSYVGGLAASFKDDSGFTWDVGGHVLFSHYDYFDRILDKLLKNEFLSHERKAYIRIMDTWVPYPFQNNIRRLPRDKVIKCLLGLIFSRAKKTQVNNFKDWIIASFGNGIAKYFMFPQNFKTWAYPLEEMSFNWIAERVSIIDLKKVIANIIFSKDDVSWGPNSRFKFPLFGGTGEMFRRFTPYFKNHLVLNKEIVRIDTEKKAVFFNDSDKSDYDILINTMPLDKLIEQAALSNLEVAAKELKHNSVFVVGLGIERPCPSNKCWMYFPEGKAPFYRATYFSNYSYNNVPKGNYYSLMCESAYSKYLVKNKNSIIDDTIQGLIDCEMLTKDDSSAIVSKYLIDVDYAYPIPTINRDKALSVILPDLMQKEIYSFGRFGAWKYESGNMDHCVMQGKETVDKILGGE